MSNLKKDLRAENSPSNAMPEIEVRTREGALRLGEAFRESLCAAIKDAGKDTGLTRYDIAGKMSELIGRDLSKNMLDRYTSSDAECCLRAEDLPAFCYVCKSVVPFQVLLAPLGYDVVGPEQSKMLRVMLLKQRRSEIDSEISALESEFDLSGERGNKP